MGGLAGHMSHLYDNPDLTLGEIKDIFIKASSGRLVGTEKTDGQNIFLSYSVRREKPVAARNLSNIKDGGLDAKELANKFGGRGNLEKSFNDSFRAFTDAVNSFKDRESIFGPDANIWYNAEIQDPRTSNVINYDNKTLTIHRDGHAEFNKETGKPMIDKDINPNAEKLEAALEAGASRQRGEYNVQMNAFKNLDGISNDEELNISLSRLHNLGAYHGLNDSSTVLDFIVKRLEETIEDKVPNLNEEAEQLLIKRLLKVRGVTMRHVLKATPEGQQGIVRKLIKNDKKLAAAAIWPLEDIVHDFSVEMLRGLESAFVLNNEEEVERLKREVSTAISAIKSSNDEDAIKILDKQMKKLKDLKNVSTAAEGFVFNYDGTTYKFTGNFAPINQLLGLFRYGRGKTPAMKIGLEEDLYSEDRKADVAFIPGSFKPPHRGHLKLMKDYLKYADRVEILISEPNMGGDNIRWINLPPREEGEKPLQMMIDADTAADLFEHYIELEGLSDKITVPRIWNAGSNNPIQYVYGKIGDWEKAKKSMNVILGVSTKDQGDEDRFASAKEQEYVNIKSMPLPPDPTKLRANDFRKAIEKAWSTGDLGAITAFLPDAWIKQYENPAEAAKDFINMIGDSPVKEGIDEASSCAGGAIEGPGSKREFEETLIREDEENGMIERKKFIEELALRESIRSVLKLVRRKEQSNEIKVRQTIRAMLQEEVKDVPYKSTGINELETLLKKIIPVIEPDYKSLTTAIEQRESYRAHILNAVKNALSPTGAAGSMNRDDIGVLDLPGEVDAGLEEDTNEEINIDVNNFDDEKFIDIDDAPTAAEEEAEEENNFSVDGEEETGRNFASMTWDRVETNIVDSYRKLSNDKDRELFYDYLIANLKLYFDKFEDELASVVDEPESEIYDQEKDNIGTEETEEFAAEETDELGAEEAAL